MPYCPRCGVETNPSVRRCPLCSTDIPAFPELGPGEPAWPSPGLPGDPSKRYLKPSQLRTRAFVVVSAVLGASATVIAAANIMGSGSLTWAAYALVPLVAVWAMTGAFFLWFRRPLLLGGSAFVVIAGLLAALDVLEGRWDWFLRLGLPLAALPFVLTEVGVLIVGRRRGYNVLGYAVGLAAVGLIAVDLLVSAWLGRPTLSWSLIAALVLVPLSVCFLFLHFGLKLTIDLKRTFHI